MYTARRVRFKHFLPFALKSVLFFVGYSTLICTVYVLTEWPFLRVPFVPIATIGTAVAFYVGFKNNSSYDRLWEGRRIWGSLLNASRSWGIMVLDYISNLNAPSHYSTDELQRIKE